MATSLSRCTVSPTPPLNPGRENGRRRGGTVQNYVRAGSGAEGPARSPRHHRPRRQTLRPRNSLHHLRWHPLPRPSSRLRGRGHGRPGQPCFAAGLTPSVRHAYGRPRTALRASHVLTPRRQTLRPRNSLHHLRWHPLPRPSSRLRGRGHGRPGQPCFAAGLTPSVRHAYGRPRTALRASHVLTPRRQTLRPRNSLHHLRWHPLASR